MNPAARWRIEGRTMLTSVETGSPSPQHPVLTRRGALQAGAIGLLGLGMNHLQALRALAGPAASAPKARSVIYIFLSGGLSQLDSFDLKPDAPPEIRGEFRPIATRTPGVRICEHLPLLAQRSQLLVAGAVADASAQRPLGRPP